MTILEQIENLNMQNKQLSRSLRTHTRKGNIKIAETIMKLQDDINKRILELMRKA